MERIIQNLKNQKINKVLFLRLRSIGDTVLLTPSIKAFKLAYPHCHLAVLVEMPSAEVLIENPYIDELIIFDRQGFQQQPRLKGLFAQFQFYRSLMNKKFDMVFNFHGGPRTIYLTLATLAKYRIGCQHYRVTFIYSHTLHNIRKILGIEHTLHTVESQYALVKWAGADLHKIELDIPFSAKYQERVRSLFKAKGINMDSQYIVFQPYTPSPRKAFPVSYLAELINRLSYELKVNFILTYGPGEKSKLEEIVALTSCSPIVFEVDLKMTAELIRKAMLFVGCNAGVMHIAAAVGTPVVALFKGISCRPWHPWCENYLIVHHDTHSNACENCRDRASSCVHFLDYDKIVLKIKSVLKKDG